MYFKIGFLKSFANLTRKYLCWNPFMMKLFSCEIFEIFKRTFFTEHSVRDRLQYSLLVFRELEQINSIPPEIIRKPKGF